MMDDVRTIYRTVDSDGVIWTDPTSARSACEAMVLAANLAAFDADGHDDIYWVWVEDVKGNPMLGPLTVDLRRKPRSALKDWLAEHAPERLAS